MPPSHIPMTAAVIAGGKIADHGILYSGSVRPASRLARPSITASASTARYAGTNTSRTRMSLLPVPRRPTTSHESSTIS